MTLIGYGFFTFQGARWVRDRFEESISEAGNKVVVVLGNQVPVNVHRDRNRAVAKLLRYHLDRGAGPECERGERVSEIMNSELRKFGLLENLTSHIPD